MIRIENRKVCDWWVYRIVNPSGRVYVGKSNSIKKRIGDYRNCNCKNQILVYRSIKKHGFESHKIEVIDAFNSSFEYAENKEMFWIRSYMSNINRFPEQNGMNLTDGGEGKLGYKHSEETKRKLSEYNKLHPNKSMLGRKLSPEQVKAMSERRKGKPSPLKGRVSEKVRLRRLEPPKEKWASLKGVRPEKAIAASILANKGRPTWNKGMEMPEAYKPVDQFDKYGNFIKTHKSIKQAAIETKMSLCGIHQILMGKTKKPRIYIFKYTIHN